MRALVLFSGGVDSTTCLALAIDRYGKENVTALSVSYGQKHQKEIEASEKIAKYYQVEHLYLDLAEIFRYSDCSLLSHSPPNREAGDGTKCLTGRALPKRECIPVTGSQTDIAFQVSPW